MYQLSYISSLVKLCAVGTIINIFFLYKKIQKYGNQKNCHWSKIKPKILNSLIKIINQISVVEARQNIYIQHYNAIIIASYIIADLWSNLHAVISSSHSYHSNIITWYYFVPCETSCGRWKTFVFLCAIYCHVVNTERLQVYHHFIFKLHLF